VLGVNRRADMAQGWINVCTHCGYTLEAWDEGNPFIFGELYFDDDNMTRLRKEYVYHPSPRAGMHIVGNDFRHLCVDCGRKFYCDVIALEAEGRERPACLKCGGPNAIPFDKLPGKPCPKCRKGHFEVDENSIMIS
jgi:hypothetical protein